MTGELARLLSHKGEREKEGDNNSALWFSVAIISSTSAFLGNYILVSPAQPAVSTTTV